MYVMKIERDGEPDQAFEFRGPGCRRTMLDWFDMFRIGSEHRAAATAITVIGTVANKRETIIEWRRADAAVDGAALVVLVSPPS
jgi:hypothetical protein